jgi:subtilisin-like proprotein convertase family protein
VTDTPVNEAGAFDNAGFSLWFGHGKVNAFHAVQAAVKGVQDEQTVDREVAANLSIPDAGAPVTSSLAINQAGTITELRVQINITHTYIGDLRVDLIAPDGTAVVLHNNTGGSAHDLVRTYSVQEAPALRSLLGRSVQGTWKLRVIDTFRLDVGRLNRWRIVARVAAAAAPGPLSQGAGSTGARPERAKKQATVKRPRRYATT